MKNLERRQGEMKKRQPESKEPAILISNRRGKSHHCRMTEVVFCPFCRAKINDSGETEVSGFPKTDHRCRRTAVSFCPFCGDSLTIENDKNALVEPQHVVLRQDERGKKQLPETKVFRWNKFYARS